MKDSQGAFVNTETAGIKGSGGKTGSSLELVLCVCARFPFSFFLLAVFLSSFLESSRSFSFGWIRCVLSRCVCRVLVNALNIDKGEADAAKRPRVGLV